MRVIIAASVFSALAAAGPASADAVQSPECQRDLATAVQLIGAIQAREKRFVRGALAKNCELLRQNLVDMVKAREPMDRCLTGHEHGETIGQLDASLGDIRTVLAGNCRK